MDDVAKLIDLTDALVDRGRTIIVIEHDLDVAAAADWVIEHGRGSRPRRRHGPFAGPPRARVEAEGSITGRHLAERLVAA
jgi:excinuclease UvrABC ATPase subunit